MQIVQLQQKIGTSDDKVQRLEASEQRLKDRVRQLEKSLEVLHHCQGKEGCDKNLLACLPAPIQVSSNIWKHWHHCPGKEGWRETLLA